MATGRKSDQRETGPTTRIGNPDKVKCLRVQAGVELPALKDGLSHATRLLNSPRAGQVYIFSIYIKGVRLPR